MVKPYQGPQYPHILNLSDKPECAIFLFQIHFNFRCRSSLENKFIF